MRTRAVKILVAIGLFGMMLGCARSRETDAAAEKPTEPIGIRLAVFPYMSNAVYQIAEAEGYFAAEGLEVEFVPVRTSSDILAGLVSGELDVGSPSVHPGLFNLIAQGAKVRLVLPLTQYLGQECAYTALLARRDEIDSGRFDAPAGWLGATVASAAANSHSVLDYLTSIELSRRGVAEDDVQLERVPAPAQGEALANGQVDLVLAVEPWATRITNDRRIGVLSNADQLRPGLTVSVVAFGARLLENPEIGMRFAAAYQRALRQYAEGKTARNIELVAQFTSLDEEIVAEACWSQVRSDGYMSADAFQEYQRWLEKRGLLDEYLEPERYIDRRFLDADTEGG